MSDAIRSLSPGALGTIAPIAPAPRPSPIDAIGAAPHLGGSDARVSGPSFSDVLSGAVSEARANERAANELSDGWAKGDPSVGIHEAMIAAEKASISLRFAVTLKNRVVEAYRELMNTSM